MNDAPTVAFNTLFGEVILRSKFEGIWLKSRSVSQHASQGIIDYLVDGGLRDKAFSHGDRVPYVGADMRLHPLCVAPVMTLSLNKLILMASGARMFNLLVAATVRCENAIIRFDTVHFMNDQIFSHLKPRITSHLVNVRRVRRK